jgi:hypothetical protein
LLARRGSFDYVVLETTGLADPGKFGLNFNVMAVATASLFWLDKALCSQVELDGSNLGTRSPQALSQLWTQAHSSRTKLQRKRMAISKSFFGEPSLDPSWLFPHQQANHGC